jgi:hypothetical protein
VGHIPGLPGEDPGQGEVAEGWQSVGHSGAVAVDAEGL